MSASCRNRPSQARKLRLFVTVIVMCLCASGIALHAQATAPAPLTLVSAHLVAKGNVATIVVGNTLLVTAYGTYSDGSVAPIAASSVTWNTSNHKVARISTRGYAWAAAAGTVRIEATIGAIMASPLTMTVVANLSPAQLAFSVQPSGAVTQAIVSPAVQVVIEDSTGTPMVNATNTVTLSLVGGAGLGGTLTVTPQNGVATFSDLTVQTAGNYTLLAASAGLVSAVSAAFAITPPVSTGETYYLAPAGTGGSDRNSGLSPAEPWLSPNHPLKCGDTILASPSTAYQQQNFQDGQWGPVTCSPGATASVAWLKCTTFDACKLTATNQNGMWVTSSYWGVQGWEVTATGGQAICFASFPPTSSANLHHIIFANDIANGCYGAGFEPVPNGSAGTDYLILVGNIAYNGTQQHDQCGSGITVFEPAQTDTLPGTHIYVAGNYTWNNVDGNPCAGGTPTDGEGIIFDTLDGNNYTQQAVMENNIAFLNGSSGFRVDKTTKAPVFLVNNTAYGNNNDTYLNSSWCGEIVLQQSTGVHVTSNISRTASPKGCGANAAYALYVAEGDDTDVIASNFAYGMSGQNTSQNGSAGFSFAASNTLGADPQFVNPPATNPGPPNCAGFASVAQCMASTFAGLLPKSPAAAGMGIQPLGGTATPDPLFPTWLCNVFLPTGLIPNHCL
jgi:Big-like domain-containing protein